ncbi:MAG TPA: hypothetical protein VEJ67_07055 [Candidatus Cybelea sp.]|nr:hypothetical protein [Candidatus Cybelea sp.]
MSKRPVMVMIIGCLLVALSLINLAFHLQELKPSQLFQHENVWVFLVRLVGMISGIFLLRGRNWARWLALAWVGLHVGISFFDSLRQGIVHSLIFLGIAYFLFRPEARSYFRGREVTPV